MISMLIPNRPPKGKNIDEILAGLPKEGEGQMPKADSGQVDGQLPKADSDLEFKFYECNFWDATQAMERDGAVYAGAPRFIQERLKAKSQRDLVWRKSCWTGELTVTSEDGMLVLPPKISRQYAEAITLKCRQHEYLVLPQNVYANMRNASTDDVKKAIDGDLPFWIPRENFYFEFPVARMHEAPFAVRICGGIEQTKRYARRWPYSTVKLDYGFIEQQKQGSPVVLGLRIYCYDNGYLNCNDHRLHLNSCRVRGVRSAQKIQTGAST